MIFSCESLGTNERRLATRPRIVVVQRLGNLHADTRAGLVFVTSLDNRDKRLSLT